MYYKNKHDINTYYKLLSCHIFYCVQQNVLTYLLNVNWRQVMNFSTQLHLFLVSINLFFVENDS